MDLGLYIHFPWCRSRCPYCDFAIAVAPLEEIPHRAYAEVVGRELEARAARFAGRRLVSIYFGGGTPALWRPEEVAALVAAGQAAFGAAAAEITLEANPNDCVPATLEALLAAGVTRLSIGAQAFDEPALVSLGRDHGADHARRAVPAARAAGFENVSLDLIYALPGRGPDDWQKTLDAAIALEPDHLSVYELTFEERTPFGRALRRGRMQKRPDDDGAVEFELAHAALGAAGYEHYEVSSYARPGRRAVHNSLYWRGAEYLGLGNGACSFWRPAPGRGLRWTNHRAVSRYLAAGAGDPEALVESREELDAAALGADALWLGLRTADGVPRAAAAGRERTVARLVAAGLLAEEGDRLRPTLRGFLLSDLVGVELLE